jgi:histone deacetylase 11
MLHIVYDDGYNVESLGPVGSRYRVTLEHLKTLISPEILQVHAPAEFAVSASHATEYLESLKDPETFKSIFELAFIPTEDEFSAIEKAQHLQYCGTLTAADLALQHGFAVNLGGGLHHASRKAGSGFCLFNDITAVVDRLLETGKAKRILIIDLDAHQGNGYEEDLWEHCQTGQVCIFDAYQPMIFPFPEGELVKQSIHYYIPYIPEDRGDCFIDTLLKGINKPFEEFYPDFVIYNAGTDTMEGDPVTKLGQTAEAIKDRDLVVIETCRRAKVPVVMCMSGGYGEDVPQVFAESLHILSEPPTECPTAEQGEPNEDSAEEMK